MQAPSSLRAGNQDGNTQHLPLLYEFSHQSASRTAIEALVLGFPSFEAFHRLLLCSIGSSPALGRYLLSSNAGFADLVYLNSELDRIGSCLGPQVIPVFSPSCQPWKCIDDSLACVASTM